MKTCLLLQQTCRPVSMEQAQARLLWPGCILGFTSMQTYPALNRCRSLVQLPRMPPMRINMTYFTPSTKISFLHKKKCYIPLAKYRHTIF